MAVQAPDVDTITRNPLEPLSPDEIRRASELLREQRDLGPKVRFVTIGLHEPPKPAVLEHDRDGGPAPDREAFAILYDREHQQTIEAVVSLTGGKVTSWQVIEDVQPSVMLEEFFSSEEITRADPRWQEAMRKRGVTDFSLTMIDPWAAGYDIDDPKGRRLVRPLTFVRSREDDNGYARPVEGLIVLVDLDLMEVIDVRDHGVVPLPEKAGNYMPELMFDGDNRPAHTQLRDDVRPIEITQPEGPSFTVDGHAVSWQKWQLRVGFSPREGLVLHQIGYEDRGTLRPIIYRASLSEMYVPYGDPAPTHRFKNVFDEGEYGVGLLLNPLELGCDCLGEIHYFDVVVNDQDGEPVTIPNAICMHEEDYGVGWKHTDFRTEKVEVRRSRRLVISCFATVGNYEYGFFWYLYTDGTIEYEVKLSGVISTGALADGEQPRHGDVVAPGLYGPHHQHFFNVRLDMQVDGERELRLRGRRRARCRPARQPVRQRLGDEEDAAGPRERGAAADRPVRRPQLVHRQPEPDQRARPAHLLQAHAGRQRAAAAAGGLAGVLPGAVRLQAPVGDGLRPARDVRRRRLPEPARLPRRAGGVPEGRPTAGERGPRRLVLLRRPPRGPPGGLAGHAGHLRRVHAQAGRVLRRQPRPRHAPLDARLPHRQRARGPRPRRHGDGHGNGSVNR